MTQSALIPVFALLGETDPFPDVVHCEAISARSAVYGWHIPAHRHGQLSQLFVITRGAVQARVDGVAHGLGDKEFLFLPAQTVHEFAFEPDTEGQVISFPAAVVQSVGPSPDAVRAALSRPVQGPVDARLAGLSEMLAETMAGSGAFRAQAGVALAHSVLALVAEVTAQNLPPEAPASADLRPDLRLSDLERLVARHIGDGWTLSDYAAALSVSPGHLSRICRAATGRGDGAYIEGAVMTEACRLLAFTRLPVSSVGYRLGYGDPSYFSRRFRAARGITPSGYRVRFSG